jgi:hypothetical protein
MNLPPDNADSEDAVRASTGAGRNGRLVTLTKADSRSVRPRRKPIAAYPSSRSATYGWSERLT